MVVSIKGIDAHNKLLEKKAKELEKGGYTVLRDVKFPSKEYKNASKIDLLAIKGNKRVGIECQIKIFERTIKQKLESYGKEIQKLIFIIPKWEKEKLEKVLAKSKFSRDFFEIEATEDVEKILNLQLHKSTLDLLKNISKKGETIEDTILRLIKRGG